MLHISIRRSTLRLFLLSFALGWGFLPAYLHAVEFVKPTAEELSMTSLPGYPGAPAVVLYREQLTRDDMHSVQYYERIKILTEEGKRYANVELPYTSSSSYIYAGGDDKTLDDIVGRTIHADSTVVPFTGKPYLKVIEKANGFKVQEMVFTLPDVQVGSILEYQYYTHINDNIFESPVWMVQDDLYVREGHFAWWPTKKNLLDEEHNSINTITWLPILPPGAKIESHEVPGSSLDGGSGRVYELHVKNIPPRTREEYMPPIGSFSYRVNFSFSSYRSQAEYWQGMGKLWSKRVNNFIGSSSALSADTAGVVAGASTQQDKLEKIYAAVMKLENTKYTREREEREDKAARAGEIKYAADVLHHGRGAPTQITELFVGMARAAGLHAYAMWVPNREKDLFLPAWMDTRQLDDVIAIVSLDGKDQFFDPGSRYCPFGQLAWQHTLVGGVRQMESGTKLDQTPLETYKANRVSRVANLKMDEHGEISGKVDLTFSGAPALRWRQAALRGDEESLHKELREHAESILPRSLEVEVNDVKSVSDYNQPLAVTYIVKGRLGSPIGKRVMLPANLFSSNETARFPHEKRETAVYFHYPSITQDAVRITLPAKYAIEAVPVNGRYDLPNRGVYVMQLSQTPNSFTMRRDLIFGDVIVPVQEYGSLRTFYSQLEAKDQEKVVLKPTSADAAVTASTATAQE